MTISTDTHAEFDPYAKLIASLEIEFGKDGVAAVAERFIDAEWADFHWDGRLAERNIGPCEALDSDEEELFERVAIVGYFHGRYYAATAIVDGERRVRSMATITCFESFEIATTAFLARG